MGCEFIYPRTEKDEGINQPDQYHNASTCKSTNSKGQKNYANMLKFQ